MAGRFLALICAGLVAFVFVSSAGSATVTAPSCAHPCGAGSQTIGRTERPAPTPCIRDVGCGGGAALGSSISVAAAVLVAVGAAALGLGVWRRRAFTRSSLDRLLAGGLFRPPRVLFDV